MSDWFVENAPTQPKPGRLRVSPEEFLANQSVAQQNGRATTVLPTTGLAPVPGTQSAAPTKYGVPPKPGAAGWPQVNFRAPLVDLTSGTPEPREAATSYGKFAAGAERGLARSVSGLTSPENIGVIGAMKLAPKVVSGLAGVYFTYEMAKALVDSLPAAKQAWHKQDYAAVGEIIGQDALNALFLGGGAKHLVGIAREGLKPVPTIERVGEVPPSKAAQVAERNAAPPGPATEPMSQGERRASVQPPSTGRHQFQSALEDPEIRARRLFAQRMGLPFDPANPNDVATIDQLRHETAQGALANLAQEPPAWWPTSAKTRALPNVPGTAGDRTANAGAQPGAVGLEHGPEGQGGLPPIPGTPEAGKPATIEEVSTNAEKGPNAGGTGEGTPVSSPGEQITSVRPVQASEGPIRNEILNPEADAKNRQLTLEADTKAANFQRDQPISVPTRGGKTAQIKTLTLNGLAIHRSLDSDGNATGRDFVLTHIASGQRVIQFQTLKEARIAAFRLSQLADFNQPSDTLVGMESLQKAVRKMNAEGVLSDLGKSEQAALPPVPGTKRRPQP